LGAEESNLQSTGERILAGSDYGSQLSSPPLDASAMENIGIDAQLVYSPETRIDRLHASLHPRISKTTQDRALLPQKQTRVSAEFLKSYGGEDSSDATD